MSGSDIFSLSFLCCLGISLLLIGLLSIYFNNKLTEQEHKISAMFGIVTTMADQIQFLRTNRNVIADPSKNGLDVNNYMPFANTDLINVSMFNLNSVDLFITQYSIVSGIVKTATILPQ